LENQDVNMRPRFVSTLNLPAFSPTELVSGGGDPVLKVWDWMRGTLVREIPVAATVEPFIRVKSARRTPRRFEDNGGDEENKKKSRKEKARAKHRRKEETSAEPSEEPEAAESLDAGPGPSREGGETVLALRRIESLQPDPSDTGYLIFSAVGSVFFPLISFDCNYP
jgi:tRNA (guanine-N(7)-)-methyltransferase subunit TRM82